MADIVICEPGTFICFICINKGMVTECLSSFPKRKLRFEPRLLRFKKLDSLPHFTLSGDCLVLLEPSCDGEMAAEFSVL